MLRTDRADRTLIGGVWFVHSWLMSQNRKQDHPLSKNMIMEDILLSLSHTLFSYKSYGVHGNELSKSVLGHLCVLRVCWKGKMWT